MPVVVSGPAMMVRVAVSALLITLLGTPACAASSTDPADVAVLQALKQHFQAEYIVALHGWTNSSTPDPCGPSGASCGSLDGTHHAQGTDQDLCAWEGVGCRNWRVTALQLQICGSGTAGKAELLQSLTSLTALEQLSLRDSGLLGSLPSTPSWSALKLLDLHGNTLTGTLPQEWGAILQQVTHLDLSTNQLSGWLPSSWGQLKQLQFLDLRANNLQGTIPSSWVDMSSLGELLFDGNCGLCGAVPQWTSGSGSVYSPLGTMEPVHTVTVTNHGTSLGDKCSFGTGVCAAYDIQVPVIAVSVVLSTLALALLFRALCGCCEQTGEVTSNPASSGDIETAAARPRLVERNGLVRLVRPQKDIPSYECCVEISVIEFAPGGLAATEGSGGTLKATQPRDCHVLASNAPEADNSNTALVAGSSAVGWVPHLHGSAAPAPSSSTSSTPHLGQGVHNNPGLQQTCPTVILMPDRQHLALAVPDTAAQGGQKLDSGTRSGGTQTGSSSEPSSQGRNHSTGTAPHNQTRDQHWPPRGRCNPWSLF